MTKSESFRLMAQCTKCGHTWNPFGNEIFVTPVISTIICPKCNNKMKNYEWYDPEFKKEIVRKKLGLIEGSDLINKINALEDKIGLLKTHLELEQSKNKVLENRLNQVENWKNIREEDFQDIERIAKDLRDDERYQEEHK